VSGGQNTQPFCHNRIEVILFVLEFNFSSVVANNEGFLPTNK
jgi:hypothetical protein